MTRTRLNAGVDVFAADARDAVLTERAALDVLLEVGAPAQGLCFLGHSAGGAFGAALSAVEPRLARIVIFANGAGRLGKEALASGLSQGRPIADPDLEAVTAWFDLGHFVAVHRRAELLVQHGRADDAVPLEAGRALFDAAASPKRWIEYDWDHGLDADPQARRDRAQFVFEHLFIRSRDHTGTGKLRTMQMHAGQLSISTHVVQNLVAAQFPQWSQLAVMPVVASGTMNAMFRIGDGLVARFPLQGSDASTARHQVESEAAAAHRLLGRTRFRTPEPVAIGDPGAGYPLSWSVQTWLPGTVASDRDVTGTVGFAQDLALFIHDVRSIEVGAQRFTGSSRGGDLRTHDAWMDECFERSAGLLDTAWLRHTWKQLRQLPRIAPDVMTHGDLIPANLLVDNGRLTGVLDVGGLAPADPALDLVGAWHCLGSVARQRLRDVLLVDDLEWARGAAWAFEQAVGLVWYYTDTNPAMSELGRRTLDRMATDLPPLPTR